MKLMTRKKVSLGFTTLIILGLGYFIHSLQSNPALFIKTALMPSSEYTPTVLPVETTDLFSTRGIRSQNTAYIYVQGGPALKRNIDNRNPLLNLPDAESLLRVHPLQTQMMNTTILNAGPELTPEQGAFEHGLNVEILNRTVKYFKDEGKTVHVICHSYGTLICHEYLKISPQEADSFVLMGFPLDLDLLTFDVGRGEIVRWVDGITPIKEDPFPEFPLKFIVKNGLDDLFANMFRLIETHAKKRYTHALNEKDLSNVIYVYGKFDEASGRPSAKELEFLARKNVEVIETFGGHRSMWSEHFMLKLQERLNAGTFFTSSITAALSEVVESDGSINVMNWYDKARKSERYDIPDEEELNLLAYRQLEAGNIQNAIEIFQLITRDFPQSANAFDSLGEAYAANRNYDLAITNYEKSIKLDPKNSHAKKMIKKLQKEKW